jgi:uncharacterized protein YqjF (DUF2071 family)
MGRGLTDVVRFVIDTAAGAFAATAGRALESDRLPPDDHRPWPVPVEPWVMAQTWEHLLFAHWPVRAQALERLVPASLPLDTFDGTAWLTVSPFHVTRLRLRGLPAVPGLSDFNEINVRTYVTLEDRPGIFFFSLDADSAPGVLTARLWYQLPYYLADAALDRRGDGFRFTSQRRHPGAPPARFSDGYRPVAPVQPAPRGSLEWWLTERYALYAVETGGRVHRAEIHHAPWPLQRVDVNLGRNTMTAPLDLRLHDPPQLVQYSDGLDVSVWRPRAIPAAARARRPPAAAA